jgi:hypothetical protein
MMLYLFLNDRVNSRADDPNNRPDDAGLKPWRVLQVRKYLEVSLLSGTDEWLGHWSRRRLPKTGQPRTGRVTDMKAWLIGSDFVAIAVVLAAIDAVGLDIVTIFVAFELRHYLASAGRQLEIPTNVAVFLRLPDNQTLDRMPSPVDANRFGISP